LMHENNLTHDRVKAVNIKTFHNATRLAGHTPQSPDEFTYAIAFPVAAMIVRGQVGVEELTSETLHDPEILRISRATHLIDDPHLTKISEGKRWAQVTIVDMDGKEYIDAPRTPRGDTDLPLSDAEISTKFHNFADPVLGQERADRIEYLSANFDTLNVNDFGELVDLCLLAP